MSVSFSVSHGFMAVVAFDLLALLRRALVLMNFLQAIPSISRSSSGNENQKLQLVLLHSAFLRTDEDAERFALHGNFTTEAAAINELEVSFFRC